MAAAWWNLASCRKPAPPTRARVVLFLSSLRALLAELLLLTGCPVPTKAQTLLTHYWTSLRAGETITLKIDGLTNLLTDSRS